VCAYGYNYGCHSNIEAGERRRRRRRRRRRGSKREACLRREPGMELALAMLARACAGCSVRSHRKYWISRKYGAYFLY